MSVEIKTNKVELPYKVRFKVRHPVELEKLLHRRFEENFNRGMRIRLVPNPEDNTFEVSARQPTAFRMVTDYIKNCSFYRETLSWQRNRLINTWREKVYNGV